MMKFRKREKERDKTIKSTADKIRHYIIADTMVRKGMLQKEGMKGKAGLSERG